MHHSEYELRLLAQQRSAELIAEAARLNRLHELRRRQRPKRLRSLLARFRRPVPSPGVVDLREPPPAEPVPPPAQAPDAGERATPAIPIDLRS
jgi:hypothetical protein